MINFLMSALLLFLPIAIISTIMYKTIVHLLSDDDWGNEL